MVSATARELTLDDRIAAQKAIEQVFWNHRIWPDENPRPKPPFSAVMSDAAIRAKVEDTLLKSDALETLWRRPIEGVQLQAELTRMASGTREPGMLRELFAALGNDPHLIAETLGRQILADRLIRGWYAADSRFGAEARARVDAVAAACDKAACMRHLGGEYSETTIRHGGADDLARERRDTVELDDETWGIESHRLATLFGTGVDAIPLGTLSPIEETDEAFTVRAVLERTESAMTTAAVVWKKPSFDSWWAERRRTQAPKAVDTKAAWTLPTVALTGCVSDTWTPTPMALVDARLVHTAVWTGSEMIVWGGAFTGGGRMNTGARYNPATDTWQPIAVGVNTPSARSLHTAIWTGTRMVVWGGQDAAGQLNSGGRYDPATDTWSPTSTGVNVPTSRASHTSVWTGTMMIVWGGFDLTNMDTGGGYNPNTDSWTVISTGTGHPSPRSHHSAVWTGTEMIVWGGNDSGDTNTGGRYRPSTNAWVPTSTGVNVPTSRASHTAVWTGTMMIVWGGTNSSGQRMSTGARYDPAGDSWSPTSTGSGVPVGRAGHTALWTGTSMVVWGGSGVGVGNTGGRYAPSTDTWSSTSTSNAAGARSGHTAVWTGTEMIVWGGNFAGALSSGGRYNPVSDSWVPTAPTGPFIPVGRHEQSTVWTGAEMIVWGGVNTSLLSSGARYSPSTNSFTPTSEGANVPGGRSRHSATWTGTEMIVWGGTGAGVVLNSGGRYNPASDLWTATSTGTNVPSVRYEHTAVWTGARMIVWGGTSNGTTTFLNTGGLYDPATDSWLPTSFTGAPTARYQHTAVWTGAEMIVWGGSGAVFYNNSGGRYDPATDLWTATSTGTNLPPGRENHTAVWTGHEMIVWGGYAGGNLASGGRYDSVADAWLPTSMSPTAPQARRDHSAVWTGAEMIIWGGSSLNSGGRYDPQLDAWTPTSTGANVPLPRSEHSAVWTGTEMIVWGGFSGYYTTTGGRYCACPSGHFAFRDADGDGYGDPAGPQAAVCNGAAPPGYVDNANDCDDKNASVHPGATEIDDAVDNQCPGDAGYGMIDELAGYCRFDSPTDKTLLSWDPELGASTYEVARSTLPSFASDCASFSPSASSVSDPEVPLSGAVFYYLVRPLSPYPGSWGRSSSGSPRTGACLD